MFLNQFPILLAMFIAPIVKFEIPYPISAVVFIMASETFWAKGVGSTVTFTKSAFYNLLLILLN